uniref:Uncharacterized protein n=1 Tax=Avena sativa TaxID=4498 RepID=A0ACD5YBX7_AVESA
MTILSAEMIDRFGRFKLWHIWGSVLLCISFPSVFGGSILGTDSYLLKVIGYSFFAAVFNIGWAGTQVAHMSMVNCMTSNPTSRVALVSCRNASTMVSNLILYGIALPVLGAIKANTYADILLQYKWITHVSIFVGCCFLVLFHAGTSEPTFKSEPNNCKKKPARIAWSYWFEKTLYYQVALLYMLARLITNVSQSLIAFYVTRDLKMNQYSKSTIPALINICSFFVSVVLQEMKWNSRRLKSFLTIGAAMWVISGAAVFVLPSHMHDLMYPLAVVIGAANALVMVTAIGLESVLVGEDLNGCAFVYGSLSFLDKISCGVALFVLESYDGTTGSDEPRGLNTMSRYGTGLIPSCFALLAIVVTSTLRLKDDDSPREKAPTAAALEAPLLV